MSFLNMFLWFVFGGYLSVLGHPLNTPEYWVLIGLVLMMQLTSKLSD